MPPLRAIIAHYPSLKPVTLIAISKGRSAAEITPLLEEGQRDFGENRAQEMASKWPGLKQQYPHIRLHMVGPMQTNKAALVVQHADFIHSLDRFELALAIAEACRKQNRQIQCFLQVNTGKEPQKSGVLPEDLSALYHRIRNELTLPMIGLMCIPPAEDAPMPHFTMLKDLAKKLALPELSMGMSDDYALALAAGATFLRIGRGMFA